MFFVCSFSIRRRIPLLIINIIIRIISVVILIIRRVSLMCISIIRTFIIVCRILVIIVLAARSMRSSWKSLDVWADHQKPRPKQLASKKCSGSEVKFVQGVHKKECLRLHNRRSDVKKRDVKRLRESSWDDL